jgi:Arc/MetJ-type ribon-helix-helix transcriptional regulator
MSAMGDSSRWKTVKIQTGLSDAIDEFISKTARYGTRKYESRADFVQEACVKLLEEEQRIKEAVVSK